MCFDFESITNLKYCHHPATDRSASVADDPFGSRIQAVCIFHTDVVDAL